MSLESTTRRGSMSLGVALILALATASVLTASLHTAPLLAAPRDSLPQITVVREGRPLAVRSVGGEFVQENGALVGSGVGLWLESEYELAEGDFRIETRLILDRFDRTAATFVLDHASHFGLDGGSGGHFFTEGPLYGDATLILDSAARHIIPGTPFTFLVERRRGAVTFSINGNSIHRLEHRGPCRGIAWRPHRGTLRLLDWRLSGSLRRVAPRLPAAYTIPMIDLSAETERQTIVDRESGQYLGHPTTALLDDGKTILCVYPKGHGRGAIVYKRSEDGGRTWSERLPTPENWATSKETPTVHLVPTPEGGRRLLLFSGLHPIRRAISDDLGVTWTPLEPIGPWGGIVAMGAVEPLADGTLAAWFHDDGRFFRPERGPARFDVYQTISRDGGLTWEEPRSIASRDDVHLCEPGVIRSPDGSRLALLLRENHRVRNSFVIFSDDEGATWSEPKELPAALTGDRHTAVYAPDGRLFISFRDTTRESSTAGDWVAWVGRFEDIVEGREGEMRVRLLDNHIRADCAYPGVVILPDGTIVTTTYGHWTPGESPYIVTIHLRLEELDERRAKLR